MHPTSGDILVGGLVQLESEFEPATSQSFLYYINGSTNSVDSSFSLPYLNMGVLGVKFTGAAAILLQYNLDEQKGEMKEFISLIMHPKNSDAQIE